MSDMYENLGNLLKDVISERRLPEQSETKDILLEENTPENEKEGNNFNKNNKKKIKIPVKETVSEQGQVLNMHKYTTFMQYPEDIQISLCTLDIAYPVTIDQIKKNYRYLIKELHPDLNNGNVKEITIQISPNVYKTIQLTPSFLSDCYKKLIDYFNV